MKPGEIYKCYLTDGRKSFLVFNCNNNSLEITDGDSILILKPDLFEVKNGRKTVPSILALYRKEKVWIRPRQFRYFKKIS